VNIATIANTEVLAAHPLIAAARSDPPESVGMRPNSVQSGVGLRLVRTFAAQLHGKLGFAESVDAAGTVSNADVPSWRATQA
jgi:hypothetical protein